MYSVSAYYVAQNLSEIIVPHIGCTAFLSIIFKMVRAGSLAPPKFPPPTFVGRA